jgi:hypothetical protein
MPANIALDPVQWILFDFMYSFATHTPKKLKNHSGIYSIHQALPEPANFGQCNLLLNAAPNELSLAVYDNTNREMLALYSYEIKSGLPEDITSEWKTILSDLSLNPGLFRKMILSWSSGSFTLVPEPLYDENHRKQYLEMVSGKTEQHEIILDNKISECDARLLFTLPQEISRLLESTGNNTSSVYHQLFPMIKLALPLSKASGSKTVYAYTRNQHFDVVMADAGKLLMVNSYPYHSPEDFIYFLLFAAETQGFNPDKDTFYLAGQIEKKSAIYNLCYKYIRNLKLANRDEEIGFDSGFKQIPAHFFTTLFELAHCG